jgi:mRNA-degrading endonuclease RelE of RelBE toxin-antitoxin system
MPYQIETTEDAEQQFRTFSAREQRILQVAIRSRLLHRPTTPTNAIKELRPNPIAQIELRVGDLRVMYNVDGDEVIIVVFGQKLGNLLIVEGEEYHEHENDPPEPSGNGTDADS